MGYEQKLKLAKEALKSGSYDKKTIEYIFPELAESEDEKIRKALIDYFDDANKVDENPLQNYGIHTDKAIAWLEKQGEPTDINPSEFDLHLNKLLKQFKTLPKKELASCLGFYLNVVQNNRTYREEKQGEQKSALIIPKFKVGDWVVYNNNHESVYQIEKIENFHYTIRHILGGSMPLSFSHEDMIRPWTIQDAKDGDVLCTDCVTFIFKHNDDGFVYMWCSLSLCSNRFNTSDTGVINAEFAHPATKEQREALEKAMVDAGYSFDFEKKELKEIEQNLDWGEEIEIGG